MKKLTLTFLTLALAVCTFAAVQNSSPKAAKQKTAAAVKTVQKDCKCDKNSKKECTCTKKAAPACDKNCKCKDTTQKEPAKIKKSFNLLKQDNCSANACPCPLPSFKK